MRVNKLLALLLVVTILLGLCACGAKQDDPGSQGNEVAAPVEQENEASQENVNVEGPQYGGVLNMSWEDGSDTLDPHYTSGWGIYSWSLSVFETAITRDADGYYQPGVCEFELSDDNKTLKLWVREGVTFHDGTPVTIEDVTASLDRAGKMVANVGKYFTDYIESLNVADGVATYTFKEYATNTLYYISGYQTFAAIMPAAICDKYGEEPVIEIEDCIGTGPYYVSDYAEGIKVELKRYDSYVPTSEELTGLAGAKMAYMDQINVLINEDVTSRSMSVLSGEYDSASIDSEYASTAEEYGLVTTQDAVENNMYIAFNTKGERPVNDVNLRKAIAAAADYDALMEAEYSGSYISECSPMAAGPYYSDLFNNVDYAGASNMELAKEYLAASNYQGEELVILVNNSGLTAAPVVLESQLTNLGLNVRLEYMDGTTIKEFYGDNSNEYDMIFLLSDTGIFSPVSLAANMRTTFWGSEKKDELFEEVGSYRYGNESSVEAWKELAQLWVDECSIVVTGHVVDKWTHDPDLVLNYNGPSRYFYNAYWTNPSEHMN